MGGNSAEMTLVRLRLLVWRTWRVSWVRWGWRFSNSKWAGREAGHGDRGWKQRPRVLPAQEKKAPQLIFHRWTHLALSLVQQRAPLVAQTVKNLPAMQETWVRSLGQENTLENRMATHSSILVWRIESHGERSLAGYSPRGYRVGHDWATDTFTLVKQHLYLL